MNLGRLTVPTGITQYIKAQTQWMVISYSPKSMSELTGQKGGPVSSGFHSHFGGWSRWNHPEREKIMEEHGAWKVLWVRSPTSSWL